MYSVLVIIISSLITSQQTILLQSSISKFIIRHKQKNRCNFLDYISEFRKEDTPITIGRITSASIHISNSTLSRVQCTFNCVESKWYLIDGDGAKPSTNGTWLYAEEPFEIYNNLVSKAGKSFFRAHLHH